MVGRELSDVFHRRPAGGGREVLRVEHVRSNWHNDVSFHINAGEVVGFAGLVGAGRTELAKVVFGELPMNSRHDHPRRQAGYHPPPRRRHRQGYRLCA